MNLGKIIFSTVFSKDSSIKQNTTTKNGSAEKSRSIALASTTFLGMSGDGGTIAGAPQAQDKQPPNAASAGPEPRRSGFGPVFAAMSSSAVQDINGEEVSVAAWKQHSLSESTRNSADVTARDVHARICAHTNANPNSDWVYQRSLYMVKPGARTGAEIHTRMHTPCVVIKPGALEDPPMDNRFTDDPGLWYRKAGIEEKPLYDWFANGMPCGKSTPKWFTHETTWALYNKMEKLGQGVTVLVLGGFSSLAELATAFGYPHTTPYITLCMMIEEKRHMRGLTGLWYLRPVRAFNGGRVGIRSTELKHNPANTQDIERDVRELYVYAARYAAQTQGVDRSSLPEREVNMRPDKFHTPVLTVAMEKGTDMSRALNEAQWIDPSLLFGKHAGGCDRGGNVLAADLGVGFHLMEVHYTGLFDDLTKAVDRSKHLMESGADEDQSLLDDTSKMITKKQRTICRMTLIGRMEKQICGPVLAPGSEPPPDQPARTRAVRLSPPDLPQLPLNVLQKDEPELTEDDPRRSRGRSDQTESRPGRGRAPTPTASNRARKRSRSEEKRRQNRTVDDTVHHQLQVAKSALDAPTRAPGSRGQHYLMASILQGETGKQRLFMSSESAELLKMATVPDGPFCEPIGAAQGIPVLNELLYDNFCSVMSDLVEEPESTDPDRIPVRLTRGKVSCPPTSRQFEQLAERLNMCDPMGMIPMDFFPQKAWKYVDSGKEVDPEFLNAERKRQWIQRQTKLLKALDKPQQWYHERNSATLSWLWRVDATVAQLQNMCKCTADSTIAIEYSFGRNSLVDTQTPSRTDEERPPTHRVIKTLNGAAAVHWSLIVNQLGGDAGLMTACRSFNLGKSKIFSGVELRTSVIGAFPSKEYQHDPNSGTIFGIVYAGFIWSEDMPGPVFEIWIPHAAVKDEKGHTKLLERLAPRTQVNDVAFVAIPPTWSRTFEYAWSTLATGDKKNDATTTFWDVQNFVGSSDQHVVHTGLRPQGFVRVSAPGLPMTSAWYAWAANADRLGIKPKDRPIFLYHLHGYQLDRNGRPVSPDYLRDLAYSPSGAACRSYGVPDRQCVAVYVADLAITPGGPAYLAMHREQLDVRIGNAGNGSFIAEPRPELATSNMEEYAKIKHALAQSWPWGLSGEIDADVAESVISTFEDVGEQPNPTSLLMSVAELTSLRIPIDIGDVQGPIELHVDTVSSSLRAGVLLPELAPDVVHGGPGWGLIAAKTIWGDTLASSANKPTPNPIIAPHPVEFALNELINSPLNPTDFENLGRPQISTGNRQSKMMVHADNLVIEATAVAYTFLELEGLVASLELDENNIRQEARRTSLCTAIHELSNDPVITNGLKAIRIPPEGKEKGYWFELIRYRLDTSSTMTNQFRSSKDLSMYENPNLTVVDVPWLRLLDVCHERAKLGQWTELVGYGLIDIGLNLRVPADGGPARQIDGAFPGVRIIQQYSNWSKGDAEYRLNVIESMVRPFIKHLEGEKHWRAVYSRTYMPVAIARDSNRQLVEFCGYCERVSVVTWLFIHGKRAGVEVEEFKEFLTEQWTQFSHIGFEYPSAREYTGLDAQESDAWHTMMKAHFGKPVGKAPSEVVKKFAAMINEVQAAII